MLEELATSARKEAGLLPSALEPPGSSVPQARALPKWQSAAAMEQWPMRGSPLQKKELALEGLPHANGGMILLREASSSKGSEPLLVPTGVADADLSDHTSKGLHQIDEKVG